MAKATVKLSLNRTKLLLRINKKLALKVQPILDNQILKDSNVYAPADTMNLIDSGIRGTKLGTGLIIWDTKYAGKQYYTKNNKSKDVNPNATDRWFEVAKKKKVKQWVRLANKAGGFDK